MQSISPDDLALELLNQCLRGNTHSPDLLEALLRLALHPDPEQARRASKALFGIVVERLADLFEPVFCDSYAALFSQALAYVLPELDSQELLERYRRIRQTQPCALQPAAVFVLSRVTLGADVAITSAVLDAAKKRFPGARIVFAGPRKNFELFAGDPRLEHLEVAYGREGTLRERLAVWPVLWREMEAPDAIVIDPDSRLTQLGLLPICEESRYFFFESRAYGEYGGESLVELTRRWLRNTFGIEGTPYIAPVEAAPPAMITVSLGVGDNPQKRLSDPFEAELLALLAGTGRSILIDKGGSAEEARRVEHAIAGHSNVRTWQGAFAPFANAIALSSLYVGYDSAGQHVAAACGTPLLTIFAGAASRRMFERWRPDGPGRIEVIRVEQQNTSGVLGQVAERLTHLLSGMAVK